MKIPKWPFHNVLAELLYSIFFQGDCVGQETIAVDDSLAKSLTIPTEAYYAIIVVECDPNQTNQLDATRFLETGNDPTTMEGMPIGHKGVWQSLGRRNMQAFRIIGVEPGRVQQVNVQYYG